MNSYAKKDKLFLGKIFNIFIFNNILNKLVNIINKLNHAKYLPVPLVYVVLIY